MHNPEYVLENKKREYFEVLTDHSKPRPDLVIMNEVVKICQIIDVTNPTDPRIKLKEM